MPHFNLADLIEIVIDTVPAEREALVCGDARQSYAELEARANRFAHYLQQCGVTPGQHVGLYLYNCNEYLEAMLGCFKVRAVPININYRYVGEELLYVFDNADLVALVHGREFMPKIAELREQAPRLQHFLFVEDGSTEDPAMLGAREYEEALQAHSPERDFAERSDDDLFILYTGGTTGLPKGVMWPHKALLYGSLGGAGFYHPDGPIKKPEDIVVRVTEGLEMRTLPLAPLMHGACWWLACISLLLGHTVVLSEKRSLDAVHVWDLVEREKVNMLSFVGDAMAIPLLDALRAEPGRWKIDSLFGIGSGGAVFSDWVQDGFREIFPKVVVTNSFGSSETGAQGQDDGKNREEGGLGRIARGEHAQVITRDGRIIEPGSGEQGYLARSGHVPIGYYNAPEKSAEIFVEAGGRNWVLTGDRATVDADGGLVIFGRGVNCINSGGEKIFPEEVEIAIKQHPAVFDALVVATPDPRFNEKVTAVVQLRADCSLDLESLQQECRKHVAGYKIPRELHVVPELTRTPSGKPDYPGARKLALSGAHLVS